MVHPMSCHLSLWISGTCLHVLLNCWRYYSSLKTQIFMLFHQTLVSSMHILCSILFLHGHCCTILMDNFSAVDYSQIVTGQFAKISSTHAEFTSVPVVWGWSVQSSLWICVWPFFNYLHHVVAWFSLIMPSPSHLSIGSECQWRRHVFFSIKTNHATNHFGGPCFECCCHCSPTSVMSSICLGDWQLYCVLHVTPTCAASYQKLKCLINTQVTARVHFLFNMSNNWIKSIHWLT